ncbi:MAG: hypothetical protein HFF77_03350 [Oscillospiraceae bacterium]|jgi:hypothetical protein|nr:hypothetical protein [Oscillospiraceae bacterium]
MAQTTSALWKTLWRTPGTTREYKFDIGGDIYGPDVEVSHSVDSGLYEQFGIGGAATAKLTISLFAASIPRAASIKRYIRLRNGEQVSEWIPKGVFFVNRRSEEDGYWTVEAFDAMRKAEQPWEPDQNLDFPLPMPDAASEFARIMGVEIDPRTKLNPAYTIDYPASDPESDTGDYYSIRQELQWIAAAHAGNWIVTGEGQLLLVPLLSIPEETSYLVTEHGAAITFGGVRLLV